MKLSLYFGDNTVPITSFIWPNLTGYVIVTAVTAQFSTIIVCVAICFYQSQFYFYLNKFFIVLVPFFNLDNNKI